MRRTTLSLLWAAAAAVVAQSADFAAAAEAGGDPAAPTPIRCVLQTERHERHEYRCTLRSGDAQRRYRVAARFSGSHDDTIASLAAFSPHGAPVACDGASKTRTMGEDGDVAVDCRVALPPATPAIDILVVVRWTHAEFVGFDAYADQAGASDAKCRRRR